MDKGNQQMTDGDSLDNLAATADPVYERQVDALMEKIMADVDENTRPGRRAAPSPVPPSRIMWTTAPIWTMTSR